VTWAAVPPQGRTALRRLSFLAWPPAAAVLAVISTLGPAPASGQERPFVTPRASVLEAGVVRVESGARFTLDRDIPLSGLRGDHLELQTAVIIRLGERVEGRVEGVPWQRMSVSRVDSGAPLARELELDGSTTNDAGDFTLATRVLIAGTSNSSVRGAVQVGVRLPNAGNESGLGRDVTDALGSVLIGAQRGSLAVSAEAGFAIFGNPTSAAAQNDQGRLGLVLELEPEGANFALGIEGRTAFGHVGPGNEIVPELAAGGRLRIGPAWADLSYRRLFQRGDEADALQAGLSHEF
jgi:hypothetical protein